MSSISKQMVEATRNALRNIDKCDQNKIKKLIVCLEKNIENLKKILSSNLSIGAKNCIENNLGHMKRYLLETNGLLIKGSGFDSKKDNDCKWVLIESAFKSRLETGVITNFKYIDPKIFLESVSDLIIKHIYNNLKKHKTLKVNLVFCGEFHKISSENVETSDLKYIPTANKIIDEAIDLKKCLNDFKNYILNELTEFQEKESGWRLARITSIKININKYEPLTGSSYIKLPDPIKNKKACINIKNKDNACFAWSIVSGLYPAELNKNPTRESSYPHFNTVLNFTGIEFPVKSQDFSKIEKLNNITINLYVLEKKNNIFKVIPVVLTKRSILDKKRHLHLLMIQSDYSSESDDVDNDDDDENDEKNYHYCLITNLSKLVSSQVSKRNGKIWICDRCLHYFLSNEKLDQHIIDCSVINNCRVKLPNLNEKWLSFKNFSYKEKHPFIIYADTESILEPIDGCDEKTNMKTIKYQCHRVHSIGYVKSI